MRALALACAVAGALGCGEPRPAVPAATAPAWRARGPGGLQAIEPGTRDPALLDADACRGCHAAEHAEWAASRHGRAWTNGIFRREYRAQPRVWCVRCHAPLAPQIDEVARGGGRLADQGVSCAACHLRGGRLVSRARAPGSPHATLVSASFGGPAFCADCHQFNFPFIRGKEVVALSRHPMQDTVGEHARGARAATECIACHASPAGHRFAGAHDPAMLDRALDATACRDRDAAVVRLANRGAGHAVPSGDVHRHVVARLWRSSAPESLFEIYVGRRYAPAGDGARRTVWDSRLSPGESRRHRIGLGALGGEAGEPLNLELVYVFTADERPARQRDPGEPTARTVVARRYDVLPPCR